MSAFSYIEHRSAAPRDKRDWAFYREQGWFDSAYYYPTHLGPVKRAVGAAADWAGAHMGAFKVADASEAKTPRPGANVSAGTV